MQYNTLIQNIQADIYSNGYELITGDILQSVLLQMVNAWAGAGAMYGGVITPASAAPADLNQATVYLALTAGTYTNFVDGGGNPIDTTGPALITYDGGASLVFAKTDLPSGGSGATIITNDGSDGDSVAIKLTENGSYQRSFRIDMTGVYTGGAVIQRIGSLIIECFDQGDDICHGYYYGDDMSEILTEMAVYQDDQDSGIYYLMLSQNSYNDSVTFAISPLDGGEVDAFITNAADGHTKLDDANISPVGGGSSDVFWATYGSTTYQQIVDAYNAGKLVACRYNNNNYTLTTLSNAGSAWFSGAMGTIFRLRCNISDSSWGADTFYTENSSYRQNSMPANPDKYHYLSTRAVYDFVKALADANGLTMP